MKTFLATAAFAALICILSGCNKPMPGPDPAPLPTPSPSSVKAVIEGPSTAMPGALINLSAAKSTGGTSYAWSQMPCCRTTDLAPATDGRSCYVGAKPGVHQLMLIVSNGRQTDIAYHTLTVSGGPSPNPEPGPLPGPAPGPGPDPRPPLPSLTGFAKFTFDSAQKVPTPTRKADATALAIELRDIGSRIAANAYSGPQEKVDVIMQAMKDKTGYREGWKLFADTMAAELSRAAKALPRAEKSFLGVPKDSWFVQQCNDAASGLEAVTPIATEGGAE